MPISLIGRIRQGGLGIACAIGLAACGTAVQPAGEPTMPITLPHAAIPTEPPTVALAGSTAMAATPASISAATPQEAIMPEKKPTLQLKATPVPEDAAAANTPPAGAPASSAAHSGQVELAKADLARRWAVGPEAIRVVEVRDVTWPNPGMGCPQPGMAYKQVPVDGLLIRLEIGGQIFEYHSGGSKAPFLCEKPDGAGKPTPASGGEGQ